ncbi:MAG: hypothetical protein H6R18_333 [Proteobacteria bacterium]|nr:hypothetical protein [Pseudomonadota bacterium]
MSGFEDYQEEFAKLDAEIAHYVAICALPVEAPADRVDIEALLRKNPGKNGQQQARETLQALLILRINLETEAIEQGHQPPELIIKPHPKNN